MAGEAVDVTQVVLDVGGQVVPVGSIGVAVLGVYVAVKAFLWVRAAVDGGGVSEEGSRDSVKDREQSAIEAGQDPNSL